ncbi:MAG: MarR family transcriptional regulator [Clostridia bacterium]|nr:MarR family transcriptional regulator [Clostridia bacterium]MBN2882640.1 MarR family transcriptional regulator [Clostridia bacterium]
MISKAEQYLKENIDEDLIIEPWLKKNLIPIYLREIYNFHEMTILGTPCILMEVINETPTIDQIQKHIKQIAYLNDRHIVLFYKYLTRYRRKSLIENRIAFIIEDGQMYLPFLGVNLKKAQEHTEDEIKTLTTPAQIAYLYFLYNKEDIVNTTVFAEKFGFNKMTASRALNDLYHINLITYNIGGKTGRSKEYKRIQDPDYFIIGRDYLKTPIRKTVYTKTKPVESLIAGLSALAGLSTINPPNHPTMAIDRNKLNKEHIEIIKNMDLINDMRLVELELWNYNPKLFSTSHHVDLLSLYLSLKEESDVRVEQALEEALRGETWYTD